MKKFLSCILLLSVCFLMGCSSGIELTEEENSMVAEYMAGVLLKYDHYYENKLIVKKDADNDETKKDTVQPKTDNSEDENTEKPKKQPNSENKKTEEKEDSKEKNNVSIADLFAGKDYTLAYKGNMLSSFYPKKAGGAYVVEAPKGKKLAVISLNVKNTSSKEKTIDLSKEQISYVLETKEQTYSEPMLTVSTSGIQYFRETIKPLKEKEAILIFAVNSDTKLTGSSLSISMSGKTAKITLK